MKISPWSSAAPYINRGFKVHGLLRQKRHNIYVARSGLPISVN